MPLGESVVHITPAPQPGVQSSVQADISVAVPRQKGSGGGASGRRFLVVVLSAARSGVDYVTRLVRHLQEETRLHAARIVVYNADADPGARPYLYGLGVEILNAPADGFRAQLDLLDLNATRDRYGDAPARVRWRAKNALDYARALEFAHQERREWPFALVLEDDVWLAPGLMHTLDADETFRPRDVTTVVRSAKKGRDGKFTYTRVSTRGADWLAWTLLHTARYDTQRNYRHGDAFIFKCCSQALLYRAEKLRPLVAYVKANFAEHPFDFLLRNFCVDAKAVVRVAVPSLAQHIGSVSSLAGNQKAADAACWAGDFAGALPPPANASLVRVVEAVAADAAKRDPRK